jgi:hypothetical protein
VIQNPGDQHTCKNFDPSGYEMCFGFFVGKNEWQGYAQLENVKRWDHANPNHS